MDLITNRYQQKTPSASTSNGLVISTPIYLNLTSDQSKQLVNAFRNLVQKQRQELGYDDSPRSVGALSVETKTIPPLTPAEEELGMQEEALRYALFARQGTPERLILKLCRLCGVYFTTRAELEEVFGLWLDEFFNDEQSTAKKTSKASNRSKKKTPATSAS